MKHNLIMLLLVNAVVITGCTSDGSSTNTVKQAEFQSLQSCIASIENATGKKVKIVTDKPTEVSGVFTTSSAAFGCTQKTSGTKGTYWEGFYTDN